MPDPWITLAHDLPYVGDEPAQLTALAQRLLDGSALLARANDGVFDARTQLASAWLGPSATVADRQLSLVLTATEGGAERLDSCRRALETCADVLADSRAVVDGLRGECLLSSRALSWVLPDASPPTDAALAAVRGRWRAAADTADAATEACRDAIAATLYATQASGGSASVTYRGLGSALGLDSLTADDDFRAGSPDAAAEWSVLGPSARALLLASAGSFPPAHGSAADGWTALEPLEREALIQTMPMVVGALGGLPTGDRDRANRLVLQQIRAGYQSALDVVGATAASSDGIERDIATATADGLRARLGRLDAAASALVAAPGATPVFVMSVDPADPDRMVVAVGNPDTADHVAVMVPGTGNDLGSIPGLLADADRVNAASTAAGAPAVASVVWLGYDAPPSLLAATLDGYADAGAPVLGEFLQGLRQAHAGGDPASVTVLLHSYAALVAARAASAQPLAADQLVFVGATGTELGSASDLSLAGVAPDALGGRITAVTFDNDPIVLSGPVHSGLPEAGSFGAQDILLPGPWTPPSDIEVIFGAPNLAQPPPPFGFDLEAHSAYYDDPQALATIGGLVARDFPR